MFYYSPPCEDRRDNQFAAAVLLYLVNILTSSPQQFGSYLFKVIFPQQQWRNQW